MNGTLPDSTVVKNAPTRSHIRKAGHTESESDAEEVEVATVLIDDVLHEVDSWRFCKLDLEGGEFRALQGGHQSIARPHSPFIVFERSMAAARWYDYSPREFFKFF